MKDNGRYEKMIILNQNSKIEAEYKSTAVDWAVRNLMRDIEKTCLKTNEKGCMIRLKIKEMEEESFHILTEKDALIVQAKDELGFVYGLYHISKEILNIQEFWFWNDQKIIPQKEFQISKDFQDASEKPIVRYRGWFVNDEVLLHTWSVERRAEEPWEMVFEALLRCGGNLVIPGTDRNSKKYAQLAASMGLIITHHHAEPLGAEMFARAYPQLKPSYSEYPEKFRELWREAILRQKKWKVIWNLGFRGQGDVPFWENDPNYQTDEARGALMGSLIKEQLEMVKAECPGAVCSTNLYGEAMELYQKGCLKLPEEVIKIWADNGYGKMVTRRQGNHNPRIPSLPATDFESAHGIYYHASFYDLQAANHMTMLPNPPEFVENELKNVLQHGANDFWIINCSNVKPHVFYLNFLAELWKTGSVEPQEFMQEYVKKYYGSEQKEEILCSIKNYWNAAVKYGVQEDEHAGEQFYNHVARMLISQYMRNASEVCRDLLWMGEADAFLKQINQYDAICRKAAENYSIYQRQCEKVSLFLEKDARTLYDDSILLQAKIFRFCSEGAKNVCGSLLAGMEGAYQKGFYLAGKAREAYLSADAAMRAREHGKWHDFYKNECLTDMKQTAWVLEGLMSYLRNLGDGPHYYEWQREFLYAEEDRRVMLIMNMENHLKDEELFPLMKEKWEDETI